MRAPSESHPHRSLPRLPAALLRLLLPRAERDEVLEDLAAEYAEQAVASEPAARRWLWRQTLRSAPALLRWSWWRGWTGFEPRANAYRPGGHMLTSLIADARYAARRLRARPGYTFLAVLTLALGIGGTAAIFGIARPLVLEPLPYANADDVGIFWMSGSWTEEEYLYLRGNFPGFRAVATYRDRDLTMRADGDAPTRLLPGIATSAELFDVLGARPLIGRGFRAGEDREGAEPVAVLSYGLWQELGGQPSILGSRITLDGSPRTVIGVMPRGFWFPDPAVRIWVPRPLNPEGRNGSYTLVGHTAPGQDVRKMDAQLARLTATMGQRFEYVPEWDKTRNASVTPIRDALLGSMRPALVATFAAMGLILLIACANVAALMLGQVEGRTSEMAVRSALGASHRRLTQQLVIEALLVGVGAGLLGAALAAAGFGVLARALPLGAWGESAAFDWSLFVVALAIAVIAVLLVVIVPSVSLWRGDLRGALSRARTGGVQGRGGRLEGGLVVAQVALAMLIAAGAALLVRSVSHLYDIDPGIETAGVAVVDMVASAELDAAQRQREIDRTLIELAELPGVRSAAAAMKLPLRGPGDSFGLTVEGAAEQSSSYFRIVTPAYFETMGIQLRDGRTFDASDRLDTPDAPITEMSVVINEALARKHFPGQNPIGRLVSGGFDAPQRIVGVVANVAEARLTDEAEPVRYYLAGQAPWFGSQATLVLRTTGSEQGVPALLEPARRIVQRSAPGFAVQGTTTMTRVLDAAVGAPRQIMMLLTLLAGLALVLGAVGIYGVISHFAVRRQRDWAIRLALGLPASRVVTHIVGQGAALVTIGIVLGAVGTVVLARLLAPFVFGVSTVDPLAFAAASAALLVTGVVAALVPAWRAGRVDPALLLREQ